MLAIVRRPIAWLPIAIAIVQLALIAYALAAGVVAGPDEGAPARIFQLLIVAQAVAILAFAARWIPRAPGQAAMIVAAQVVVAAVPVAAILLLES